MIDLTHNLRKLAKSSYWQTLFASSKLLNGIELFENKTNFTKIQLDFINWLSYYNSLNYYLEDGSLPEWAYKKDIYIDAFMYYKRKQEKKGKGTEQFTAPQINNVDSGGKVKFPGLKVVFKNKK